MTSYPPNNNGDKDLRVVPGPPYPSTQTGRVLRSSLKNSPHYAPRSNEMPVAAPIGGNHQRSAAGDNIKRPMQQVAIEVIPSHLDMFASINVHHGSHPRHQEIKQQPEPVLCTLTKLKPSELLRLKGQLYTTEIKSISRAPSQLGSSITATCLSVSGSSISSNHKIQVATGLSTGSLCIHTFADSASNDDSFKASSVQFARQKRPATAVSWRLGSPTHVAIGMPAPSPSRKARAVDYGTFVWDISQPSATAIPLYKVSHNTGVASLTWMDHNSLVAGCQARNIQLYDLRSKSPSLTLPTRSHHEGAVYKLAVSQSQDSLLASYSNGLNEPVKIWDLRQISDKHTTPKPLMEIKVEDGSVSAMDWSNDLSICSNNCISRYDTGSTKPFLTGQVYASHDILDMTVAPRDRFCLVLSDKTIVDTSQDTFRAPIAISRNNDELIHAFHDQVWTNKGCLSKEHDISSLIQKRASQSPRYSMNPRINAELLLAEPNNNKNRELIKLWKWIQGIEENGKTLMDGGVWNLLNLNKEINEETTTSSFGIETFDSTPRRTALESCGWVLSGSADETTDEWERTAATYFWCDEVGNAVKVLQEGAKAGAEHGDLLQLLSIGIAGYNGSNVKVWQQACASLLKREELQDDGECKQSVSYLRALLHFLLKIGQDGCLSSVLNDDAISLCDRIGFACRFLGQTELRSQLNKWIDDCQSSGNVEGLVITGLHREGIKILQAYVDRTCDVQTAALVSSRVSMEKMQDRRVCSEWLDSYRGLLNSWQLWKQRAMFDVDRADLLRKTGQAFSLMNTGSSSKKRADKATSVVEPDAVLSPSIPAQMDARCNYCSLSLSGARPPEGTISSHQWLSQSKPVIPCCPRCRKPLPRCAICLLSLGCLNPYMELKRGGLGSTTTKGSINNSRNKNDGSNKSNLSSIASLPLAEWFTWCMRCKHGGHAHHLATWFSKHETCPVSGCDCNCQFDVVPTCPVAAKTS